MKFLCAGIFVVLEGLDRSGKTTMVNALYESLYEEYPVCKMAFPDRSTSIGRIIDDYLKGSVKLSLETIHLLFTANRYDNKDMILSKSENSILLCDRYSWSGITCSVAKGLEFDWCVEGEKFLPKPDLIIYLKADVSLISKRKGFGMEVLETVELQEKMKNVYDEMMGRENVVVLDAANSVEENTKEAVKHILKCLEQKTLQT